MAGAGCGASGGDTRLAQNAEFALLNSDDRRLLRGTLRQIGVPVLH
jgi:hypothetical protein